MALKETGVVAGVVASVAGAFLLSSSLRALIDERDHLRSQVGAMSRPTAPGTWTPPATSSPPPHSNARTPGPTFAAGPPGATLIVRPATRIAARSAPPAAYPGKPAPHPAPSPAPRTSPCSAALVTAQLPLGVLPCSTLTADHVARIGGTRK